MPFLTAFGNRVMIKPRGSSGYTEVAIFGHNHNESDEGHDVTSSVHQGMQALVASILRGGGTIRGHIRDADVANNPAYPWVTNIVIVAQGTGIIKLEYADRQAFQIAYFISNVEYTNETAGGTDFAATFKFNAEAASSPTSPGTTTYVRPL